MIWPFLLVGTAAFYGSYLLGASNFWLSFALLTLTVVKDTVIGWLHPPRGH